MFFDKYNQKGTLFIYKLIERELTIIKKQNLSNELDSYAHYTNIIDLL